jgi:hypothetical protein
MQLPAAAHQDLSDVLERLLRDALPPSGRPHEVAWFKKLHQLIALNLEPELAGVLRRHRALFTPVVHSALVHASPFYVRRTGSNGPSVEIGDMLLVGSAYHASGQRQREALLLQLKVGKGHRPYAHTQTWNSTRRQAELYASWPQFEWTQPGMVQMLTGSSAATAVRNPVHAPCRAAQLGFIPSSGRTASGSEFLAREVGPLPPTPPVYFQTSRKLCEEWATVLMLGLGIDATPTPLPSDGWSQIVDDMLYVAWQITSSGSRDVYTTLGGFLNRLTAPRPPHLLTAARPLASVGYDLPEIRSGEPTMLITHVGLFDEVMFRELRPKEHEI